MQFEDMHMVIENINHENINHALVVVVQGKAQEYPL
jgi:hypothetical protein